MPKGRWHAYRELAFYSSIGLTVALSIFIGLGVGVWLDRRLATQPWLTFLFLGLGIAAGYRNIGLAIRKIRNQSGNQD
ncbi:MAG: AtpZ/AtpI family protein [Desulfobacterales bacterium]